MFQHGHGDWKELRQSLGASCNEVDLHFDRRDRSISYESAMAEVSQIVRDELKEAQDSGTEYVMFVHGWSTSRNGKTTARSVVRSFMRSVESTQFIKKRHCIQHDTVFVAKIKAKARTP